MSGILLNSMKPASYHSTDAVQQGEVDDDSEKPAKNKLDELVNELDKEKTNVKKKVLEESVNILDGCKDSHKTSASLKNIESLKDGNCSQASAEGGMDKNIESEREESDGSRCEWETNGDTENEDDVFKTDTEGIETCDDNDINANESDYHEISEDCKIEDTSPQNDQSGTIDGTRASDEELNASSVGDVKYRKKQTKSAEDKLNEHNLDGCNYGYDTIHRNQGNKIKREFGLDDININFTTQARPWRTLSMTSLNARPDETEESFCSKITKTACACAAYFGVALNLGLLGPSLIDLEQLTGTTTSQISTIFTCRGILAIVGSLILGPMFDRMNRYLLVGVSLFFTSIFVTVAPWTKNIIALLAVLAPPEFFGCAIGMGTHLICISIWKNKSGPSLQLLNLISVVGFTLAPLIVKPFMAPEMDAFEASSNSSNYTISTTESNSTSEPLVRKVVVKLETIFLVADERDVDASNVDLAEVTVRGSLVQYAYLIVGIYCLAIAVWVLVTFAREGCKLRNDQDNETVAKEGAGNSNHFELKVSVLFFLFNIFYGGIEIGYAGLVMTFAVKHLGWSKSNGTYVVALVQFSNATVTALAVVFSKYVKPHIIVLIDLVVVLLSLILLCLTVESTPGMLWVCTALVGAGYACIMPSSFTWANSFMDVDGKFSSFYWCGFFVGFMAIPSLTGYLFNEITHMCFPYMMLTCSVMTTILFAILWWVVRKRGGADLIDTKC